LSNSALLRVFKDGRLERNVALERELSIGRHQRADLQLEHPELSRIHALVRCVDDRWVLQDNKSLNGTFLEGRRLDAGECCELRNGVTVVMGGFELRFELPEPLVNEGVDAQTYVQPAGDPAPALVPSPAPAKLDELEQPPVSGPLLSGLVEARSSLPVWSEGEADLVVADIIEETPDVKTFRLVGRDPLLFSYKPGQFVTLAVEVDGKEVKRSYSVSSSPSRPHTLELTVKRVPGGLVSNWLCDNMRLGESLKVRGPSGKFSCFDYPSRKMLFIGAGSGITPLMSMSRWIVDTTADVDVILMVSARTPNDIIFRKELENMAARNSNFRLVVTVTAGTAGTEAWSGFMGRCSEQMIRMIAPDLHERHVFMCGPRPFSEAVKSYLKTMDFALENLHTESFGGRRVAPGTPVAPRDVAKSDSIPVARTPVGSSSVSVVLPPSEPAEPEPVGGFAVTFSTSGRTVRTDGEASLLDLAEANGIEIDYACRAGSCGSCRVRVLNGEVEEDDNDLDDDERAEGWRYACVSRPCADVEVEA